MLRFIFVLILPLFAFAFTGYYIATFPSAVLLKFSGYEVRINLIVWLMLSLLVAWALLFVWKIVRYILRSPQMFSRNAEVKKQNKANRFLRIGLQSLIEGHYAQAEKYLYKGGELAESVGMNAVLFYENAAIAANYLQAEERRDMYLLKARENGSQKDEKLTRLAEAEILLQNQDYLHALPLLESLYEKDGRNLKIVALLDACYVGLQKWDKAWYLLPKLRSQLTAEEFEARRKTYAKAMLGDTAEIETYEQLLQAWKVLPSDIRQDKEMVLLYAGSLVENGHADEAEKLLSEQIRKTQDLEFIQAFSQIRTGNPKRSLTLFQDWEKAHHESAIFQFAKAQTAFFAKEYEIANIAIEKSIQLQPSNEAFVLWAHILEAKGMPDAALIAYREGVGQRYKDVSLEGDLLPQPQTSGLSNGNVASDNVAVSTVAVEQAHKPASPAVGA